MASAIAEANSIWAALALKPGMAVVRRPWSLRTFWQSFFSFSKEAMICPSLFGDIVIYLQRLPSLWHQQDHLFWK